MQAAHLLRQDVVLALSCHGLDEIPKENLQAKANGHVRVSSDFFLHSSSTLGRSGRVGYRNACHPRTTSASQSVVSLPPVLVRCKQRTTVHYTTRTTGEQVAVSTASLDTECKPNTHRDSDEHHSTPSVPHAHPLHIPCAVRAPNAPDGRSRGRRSQCRS